MPERLARTVPAEAVPAQKALQNELLQHIVRLMLSHPEGFTATALRLEVEVSPKSIDRYLQMLDDLNLLLPPLKIPKVRGPIYRISPSRWQRSWDAYARWQSAQK